MSNHPGVIFRLTQDRLMAFKVFVAEGGQNYFGYIRVRRWRVRCSVRLKLREQ